MSEIVYRKNITPMDVYELFKNKGVKPSDVEVREDGETVTIIVKAALTEQDKAALDNLVQGKLRVREEPVLDR